MRIFLFTLSCLCLYACQQELDPSLLNSPTPAQFTLTGSPNNCSNAVVSGSYKKNVPLVSANKLTIDVQVNQLGSWNASTNTVNGVSFSGSGNFSALGSQTILLQGSGVPTQSGTNTFNLSAGTNQCSFTIIVDTSSVPPPAGNIPPVANAGADKNIVLPSSTVTLSGSGSDADGTIVSYLWTKISGPGTFSIVSATQAQTTVNNLVQGIYLFELKVTDNGGAVGKDTVSVSVQAATAASGTLARQQWIFASVSTVNDIMNYDGSGKATKISSDYHPERRITYKNNKISTIEWWYDQGSGNLYKDNTDSFLYNGNGNVVQIIQTNNITGQSYVFGEFTYNADNTLQRKKTWMPSGSNLTDDAFFYTNGNLTAVVTSATNPNPGDTTYISYDNRTNNFKQIYPQYYFLDILTAFDQTDRSEMFFFSNNYPVSYGTIPISVSTNPSNQKPYEIKFDNVVWYRYLYN